MKKLLLALLAVASIAAVSDVAAYRRGHCKDGSCAPRARACNRCHQVRCACPPKPECVRQRVVEDRVPACEECTTTCVPVCPPEFSQDGYALEGSYYEPSVKTYQTKAPSSKVVTKQVTAEAGA